MQRRILMQCTMVAVVVGTAISGRPGRILAADRSGEADVVPDGHLTAPLKVPASGTINVAFLISSGAEVVDFAGPWGVFEYVIIGDDHRRPFRPFTVAASKRPVKVSSGLTVVPNHDFDDAPTPDVVVVPAMNIDGLAPAALEWLRAVQKKVDVTMSVCNGAYILGEAGLLEGRSATAHHYGYGGLRAYATVIRGVRYVEDGKIATSGGLTSGMDLALRVVERYFGRKVAQQTALNLEYQSEGWMRPKSNAQFAETPKATPDRPICPDCEMAVNKKAALQSTFRGHRHYLCGKCCKKRFLKAPQRFVEDAR